MPKSAIKSGLMGSNGNGNRHMGEGSVRSNTYANRRMNQGMLNDEEFYDEK